MKTTDEWMAETMQPILDRIAGVTSQSYAISPAMFSPNRGTIIVGNKAADQLPDGCGGCRVDASGNLICCVNQGEEE